MRIKCTVTYDGSAYIGWQAQPDLPSIQGRIERSLWLIHKKKVPVHASGRTDGQVHAIGQVFHFDSHLDLDANRWKQALNGTMPNDIYIKNVELVDDSFHSRHSCLKKTYLYRFSFGEYNVHREKYCLQLKKPLDIEAIKDAAQVFVGVHDFTSFNVNRLEDRPHQIRNMEDIHLELEGDEWVLSITGNGFLRYMVRMMVGSLIEVGYGRLDKQTLVDWLNMKDKTCCRHNAPPQGLYLKEVFY